MANVVASHSMLGSIGSHTSGSDNQAIQGATSLDRSFRTVKEHLDKSTSLNEKQKRLLATCSTIEEVHQTVSDLILQYESRTSSSKTRKWLQRTSETICHYGNVLDVFVQHNPEYVALVWGTFKLLFSSAINHAETLKLIAKSISQIAMRLPRVKTLSELYSTPQMRQAIEELYTHILEFLMIGYSWITESKLKHFYHSFTQPVKLQYHDVLERITNSSNNIMELATLCSQTEIRIIHRSQTSKLGEIICALENADEHRETQLEESTQLVSMLEIADHRQERKLDLILSLLESSGLGIVELLTRVEVRNTLQTSCQLNTDQGLSIAQLDHVLSTLSRTFPDPENIHKHHLVLSNRRSSGPARANPLSNSVWISSKLKTWASSQESSFVIVKGAFNSRAVIQDFGTSVIQSLLSSTSSSSSSTIWALPGLSEGGHGSKLSQMDLIKYLCYQILRLSSKNRKTTEKAISIRSSQFQSAHTLKQWLDLLKLLVSNHTAGQLYIILDLAILNADVEREPTMTDKNMERSDFIRELHHILMGNTNTAKVKTCLLIYEADWGNAIPDGLSHEGLVTVNVNMRNLKPRPGLGRGGHVTRDFRIQSFGFRI